MTRPIHPPTPPSTASLRSGLRSLYLLRAAFSIVWVVLVFVTCHSLRSDDTPSAIAAVLLVAYPIWDAVATVLELRIAGHGGAPDRARLGNVALGVAAAAAMAGAVFTTVMTTLIVFGVWAALSGAVQLTVALRRRRTMGAQWPMVLSGGISVLAGIGFVATSGSASSGLGSLAGYSAVGAVWFIVAVVALRRVRDAEPSAQLS